MSVVPGRQKICRLFLLLLVAGLFLSYPLALIPPGFIRLGFGVVLPSVFLLSLFAMPLLVRCRWTMPWPYITAFAIFAIAVFANLLQHRNPEGSVTALGSVLIPLAIAVAAVQTELLPTRRLAKFAFFYWLVQIFYGTWGLATAEAVGLAGNRNWMASLLLALLPGCWLFVRGRLGPGLRTVAIFAIGCGLPTFILVHADASRSAWLSLIVLLVALPLLLLLRHRVAFLAFFRARSTYNRVMIVLLLVMAPITVLKVTEVALLRWASPLTVPQRLLETVREDVRVPLYASTARLIRDNPWLGVGPGNFRREFVTYRSQSTYHNRLVAARVTMHPHNEALHIAAQLGIPAMLAWLALLLPIGGAFVVGDRREVAAAATAYFLYFQSFLDQTLFQAPGCLIAFVALGLLWARHLKPLRELSDKRSPNQIHRTAYSLCVLTFLCGAIAVGSRELRRSQLMRKGRIAERLADYQKAYEAYDQAAQVAPRHPRGHFFAGLVAVDRLKDGVAALQHFQALLEVEPDYAIVNAKIGKTLGMLGRTKEALPFFDRHCLLYPRAADGFQEYIICLAINGHYDEMPDVLDHLRGIYAEKASLSHGDNLDALKKAWRDAVLSRQITAAIDLANQICTRQDLSFVDPALHFVLPRQRWPSDFLHDGFNAVDYIYWERSLAAEMLVEELPGDVLTQATTFLKATPNPPPATRLDLVAVLARKHGLLPFARVNDNGDLIGCTLIGPDSCQTFDWSANSATACEDAEERGSMVLQPQAFLLKNQVLGSLVGIADLDVMPTIMLSNAVGQDAKLLELGAACYPPLFEELLAKLKELENE